MSNPLPADEFSCILIVHNRYRVGNPAGEDNAYEQERDMLEHLGIRVITYERSNDEVGARDLRGVVRTLAGMTYSNRTYKDLAEIARVHRPSVAHFHNTFPLISSSGYLACNRAGIPVVQTLHNYRLLCPAATFYRDGSPCEACSPKSFVPAIKHGCYRSTVGSVAVARMLTTNWRRKIYLDKVDQYIALTNFAARKFASAGIPPESISIKPNFVRMTTAEGAGDGGYAAFVGKFVPEKGVRTLLEAWRGIPQIPLKMIGTGPLDAELREFAAAHKLNVHFEGMLGRQSVIERVRAAAFVVVPSEWYEGFPLVIVEAYACGTPVLASDIGGLTELIRPGITGDLFAPHNPDAIRERAKALWAHPDLKQKMRQAARSTYLKSFTEEKNSEALLAIYRRAIAARRGTSVRNHSA